MNEVLDQVEQFVERAQGLLVTISILLAGAAALVVRLWGQLRAAINALKLLAREAEPHLDKSSKAWIAVDAFAAGALKPMAEAAAAAKPHQTNTGQLVNDEAAMKLVLKHRAKLSGVKVDDLKDLVARAQDLEAQEVLAAREDEARKAGGKD